MAASSEENETQSNQAVAASGEEDYKDIYEEEEEEEEEEEAVNGGTRMRPDRARTDNLFRRMSTERVPVRVHDVFIKGNTKTKDSVIEAELEALNSVTSVQELIQAASIANANLHRLDIFDSVNITLDAGPPELPGTANVVVEVTEAASTPKVNVKITTEPEARSWSPEGSLKLKNLFGYGDIWDGYLAGWDKTLEISAGVSLPRFKRLTTPVKARLSLLSQDWLKISSYKERALGLSLGLLSSRNNELEYNLSWRTLTDPSQMASSTVRRQLGHRLESALKNTYKIDTRDSPSRPTQGYAFASISEISGLSPDYRSLRSLRQVFDLRYALPLGFYNAALNFGISAGAVFPWGKGSLSMPSYLPQRFFMGGNSSPVCFLGGPTSVFGFKSGGLGPAEPRRLLGENASGLDFIGGDLAINAFADLSFDLPLKILRDAGIHGHAFVCTGSNNKLTENAYRDLSFQKFRESFRASTGFGVIIPIHPLRMEVNYYYILKQQERDRGKTGLQFSFSMGK